MIDFEQAHPPEELLGISPEGTLRDFVKFFREIKSRYEEAVRLQGEYESQINDLQHYAELHPNLNAAQGNKLYRKLAEALRNRRACKIEVQLLEPMYQYVVKSGHIPDQLSHVQGKVHAVRERIEERVYYCRTDVLDDMPS